MHLFQALLTLGGYNVGSSSSTMQLLNLVEVGTHVGPQHLMGQIQFRV
jgi:hypothetical protein